MTDKMGVGRPPRKYLKTSDNLQSEQTAVKYGLCDLSTKKRTSSTRIISEQTHWFYYFFEWLQKKRFLDLSYWQIFDQDQLSLINSRLKSHYKCKRELIERLGDDQVLASVQILLKDQASEYTAVSSPLQDIVDAYRTFHSYLETVHGEDYVLFIEKHMVACAGENFSLTITFAMYLILFEAKLEEHFLRKVIFVFCLVAIYFDPRGVGITRKHVKSSKLDFFYGQKERFSSSNRREKFSSLLSSEFAADYANEYVQYWEKIKNQ